MRSRSTPLAAVSAFVVLTVCVAIMKRPLHDDRLITRWSVGHRRDWMIDIAHGCSAATGPIVVVVLTAACATGFVIGDRGPRRAVGLVAAVGGSLAVAVLVRIVVERRRPPVEIQLDGIQTAASSFPSLHTVGVSALTLTVALLATQTSQRIVRWAVVATAVVIAGLACAARVELGMAWTSDAIGGMILGVAAARVTEYAVGRYGGRFADCA